MADLTLVWDGPNLRGDLLLGLADIATGNDLRTNVMTSLSTDPGWWGNTYEPDAWGCRLLELRRAKHSNETLLKARDYCRAALKWLLDDRVARSVDVQTGWQGSTLAIGIVVTQATGTSRFSFVWDEI